MQKLFALALVLGVAVLVGGVADATGDGTGNGNQASAPIGVRYDWAGGDGEMSIVGAPGMPFQAFDSLGQSVAAGVLSAEFVSVPVGNSGTGADGVVLHVIVGDDIVAVADPDWEWN